MDPDSPIRVVVTPSQSAYFAGETLSVTITFTNTRTRSPEAGPNRSARTHKRASHSISSAPIARPPTSPAGLYKPQTPGPETPTIPSRQSSLGDGTLPRRRGLIGKRDTVPDLVEQRRNKMLTKSLSLTISPHEDEDNLQAKSASYLQKSFSIDAYPLPLTSPKISSPLARSETLPLPSKHPHARKQSVLDGTPFSQPPNDISVSPTSPASATSTAMFSSPTSGPNTPSASTSSFSLALDPIAEVSPGLVSAYPYLSPALPSAPIGPSLSSPSISVEAPSPPSASAYPPSNPSSSTNNPSTTRQTHRPPKLGVGKPSNMFLDLRKSNNTELILYSYAQLKGTVTLTPLPSNDLPIPSTKSSSSFSPRTPAPSSPSLHFPPSTPQTAPLLSAAQIEQQKAQTLNALRHALLKGSTTAVGGGSMDITSRTHSRTPSAGGVASLGGGLGSGSWGSFGGAGASTSAGPVSAYGPPSAKPNLETINSGSTDGAGLGPSSSAIPSLPSSAGPGTGGRRPTHSRSSSFSAGLLSILGSPFGLGSPSSTYSYNGQVPMSAPPVSNLAASMSVPNVNVVSAGVGPQLRQQHQQQRNRASSAGLAPSSSSGWPSAASSAGMSASSPLNGIPRGGAPVSAGLTSPGLGSGTSRSGLGLGLGLGWPLSGLKEELIDPEIPLPTFEAQSAMLAVDVPLEPGESRSYSYSILLPSNLPPTFRGRTFRFAYELVVGICRSSSDSVNASANGSEIFPSSASTKGQGKGPGGSVSKVMKVPIRVYTNVVVGRSPTPYDLLWPAIKRRSTQVVLGHRRGGGARVPSKSIVNKDKDNDPYTGKVVELDNSNPNLKTRQDQSQNTVIAVSDSSSSLSLSTSGTGTTQASTTFGSINELKEYARSLVDELPQLSPKPEFEKTSPIFLTSTSGTMSASSPSNRDRGLSPLAESEEDSVDGTASEGDREEKGERKREEENSSKKANGNANANSAHTSVADLAWKEKERIARLTMRQREREESDEPIPVGGCGEAVEILTRNPKKVSYDVNKDGVKVAVLTFIKSAFRLGETIQGVVELNQRTGRGRVVQLSAHLETQESLPYPISTTPSTPVATRQLKRVHAEHHSSFVLETLRTTFSLDIPSDASPGFQMRLGEGSGLIPNFDHPQSSDSPAVTGKPSSSGNGGLEWKVRLCLLVAVAKESSDVGTEGVRFKSLVRDGPRGEWGSAWKAPQNAAPCEKPGQGGNATTSLSSPVSDSGKQGVVKSWASFIAASFLGSAEGGYHDGDDLSDDYSSYNDDDENARGLGLANDDYDGIKPNREGGVGAGVNFIGGKEDSWNEVLLETVECDVPVRVWPGNTAFKPADVMFDV